MFFKTICLQMCQLLWEGHLANKIFLFLVAIYNVSLVSFDIQSYVYTKENNRWLMKYFFFLGNKWNTKVGCHIIMQNDIWTLMHSKNTLKAKKMIIVIYICHKIESMHREKMIYSSDHFSKKNWCISFIL